ncbi:NOT2 family protein [Mycena alexandri]|uniref:NOT2 family protein n=1 Tax=Mycena alexandri TaxID=1745969 RepID=A0AAD6T1V2_9AGAR|nr:NOT2 family protein [Mycena alexandri]
MNRASQQRAPSQQQPQYRPNPQPAAPYTQYPIQQRLQQPGAFLAQPQRVPLPSPFMPPRATNGTTNNNFPFGLAGLPPHLQQQQQTQPQHDAALDPNDFPALGAPPAANNPSSGTPQSTSSYASAGAAPQPAPHVHQTPARDLTQDDFPALGENAPTTAPPGLFPAVPGMLNLSGMGMMGRHPGPFEEKRHTNPPNPAPPNLAAKANPPPPPPPPQQPPTPSNNNAAWPSNGAQDANGSNNNNAANNSHPSSGVLLHAQGAPHHPQTPAQQVLVSAADRWGLLGLLAMIREAGEADFDASSASARRLGVGVGVGGNGSDPRGLRLSGVGTDLGTMGLDMGFAGNLYSTFITPWADQSAAHAVEPDFHLPACYASVHAPPPGPSKASAFSDETLFFMFYSSARDALQEVAAQELWNRNWRYHKDLRLWITKESGTAPSAKVPGGEQGLYTIWDAEAWGKEHKEMSVLYAELEEKNSPAFVVGPGLVLQQQVQSQQQQQVQSQQQQGQPGRGFGGM